MAVVWRCLAVLGVHTPAGVLALAYFLGHLPNNQPIPGGVGVAAVAATSTRSAVA